MKSEGILAGIYQSVWTDSEVRLVVCVTETKKRVDLDRMAEAFARALQS
jgi:hypothetical protein